MKTNSIRSYIIETLKYALNPRSVAVIGASRHPGKVGHEIVRSLQEWKFSGRIFPINPHALDILGLQVYRSIREVPEEVDFAFLTLPADRIPGVVEECVRKEVKVVAVASSGLKESGEEDLEDEITRYCRSHRTPLLGPNLLALGNPHVNFHCGLIPNPPVAGPVAVISQSGANLLAALGATCPTRATNVVAISEVLLDLIGEFQERAKPLIAEFQGGEECVEAASRLRVAGIPAYSTPERAAGAMIALHNYALLKARFQAAPEEEALSVR